MGTSMTKGKYVSKGPSPESKKSNGANGGGSKGVSLSPKAPGGVVTSRLNAGGDMSFQGSRGKMKSHGAKY